MEEETKDAQQRARSESPQGSSSSLSRGREYFQKRSRSRSKRRSAPRRQDSRHRQRDEDAGKQDIQQQKKKSIELGARALREMKPGGEFEAPKLPRQRKDKDTLLAEFREENSDRKDC